MRCRPDSGGQLYGASEASGVAKERPKSGERVARIVGPTWARLWTTIGANDTEFCEEAVFVGDSAVPSRVPVGHPLGLRNIHRKHVLDRLFTESPSVQC